MIFMLPIDRLFGRSVRKLTVRFVAGIAFVLTLLALAVPASAQLTGTYTIGGVGATYTSIDAAVAALSTGVTGPVTFLIRSGTYAPPSSGGWRLPLTTGMSATNTVTFKPDANATVSLIGNSGSFNASGVFTIDGGKYFIIDGSNTAGGTSRDMSIIQTEVNYNSAIIFKNDADNNVVKNVKAQASGTSAYVGYGYGVIFIGQGTGNDNNLIQNCQLGDPNGTNRSYTGVTVYGSSNNLNNRIIGNDIINFRYQGVYVDGSNTGVTIQKNQIHMTVPTPNNAVYGIYINENTTAQNVSIDSNSIYKLMPTVVSSGQVIDIYSNVNNIASGSMQITNNMLSFAENGYIYYYGIYMSNNMSSLTSTTYTDNVYYNSLYMGGVATNFAQTIPLYRYSYSSTGLGFTTINHKNNIYYSTRSGGSSTSYGLYVYSSPSGGWNSNNNLINLNSDVNYYTAYYNFSLYLTTASYQTSGQDVNSVNTNPQFVDPLNGDLHISTTKRTAIEGRGTNLPGFTTDFDGQTRNAATPDIGADEGNFLTLPTIDAAADHITTPLANAILKSNTSFTPVGFVVNNSSTTQTIPIRMRILNASTGAVVYNDLWNYSISALTTTRIPFNVNGNQGGSTLLTAGTYTVELSTSLGTDLDASNNVVTETIYVKDPLNGAYTLDKNGAGARNYTSFTSALIDLNAVGVTGAVTFSVAGGTYDSTTETFPLKFAPYPGASASNNVTFKPAANARVVMASAQYTGQVIDFNDGDYYVLDGSNTVGGTSRDWRVANTNWGSAIRFFNASQYNTIKNMYLMAYNPSSTGIIYMAGYGGTPTGNSYNTIIGNTIGDSTGTLRSFANIYLSGDFSYRNTANTFDNNDIINWGANANGGGYGIYWLSYSDNVKIFRNRFTQLPAATAGLTSMSSVFAIYISTSYNTNDTIAYNKIWGLNTPTATSQQAGIYISFLGTVSPLSIHNNMITLNGAQGNLWGIYAATSSSYPIFIEHNSIHLLGTSAGGTNYISGVIRTSGSPNLTIRNNIFTNERTYPTASLANYVYYRQTLSGTFTSNYNLLYTNGISNQIAYNNGTNYATLANWQSGTALDLNSVTNRPPYMDVTTGDLHINPVPIFTGEGQGTILNYARDFDSQTRDLVTPDIGADDGDFNGGGLKLTYPNGGEVFAPMDAIAVQYTANRAMSVRIELSGNGGTSWTQLATVNPTIKGNNTTNVTLPDLAINQATLRVISQKNMYEADTTDASFRVVRKLQLTAPNGLEKLYVGDTTMIKWNRRPGEMLADNINLEYSIDGGANWRSIATGIPGFIDSLPWIVPNAPTTTALIRMTNRELPRYWDTSNAAFSILNSTLQLATPNGGENYEMNQPVTVTWSSQNTTNLALYYTPDNGATWQTITNSTPASAGSYTFTPNAIPTKLARVRIVNVDRTRINDQSDNTFTIMEAKSIAVFTPSEGDRLVRGSSTVITWDAPRITSVNILYSSDGGGTWNTIASNVLASEGSRVWTVPNSTTTRGKIRIQEVGGTVIGESNLFSVVDPSAPTITVIAPNGGEKYTSGDSIAIRWSSNDVTTVTIAYSDDNGSSWHVIQASVPATLSQIKWVAPDVVSTTYLVRVSSNNPAASDQSNAPFAVAKKLQPQITVLYANGGENLTIDSTVQIRWTAQDITGNVKIELSRDGGLTFPDSIGSAPATAGTFDWKVTGPATKQAVIRVGKITQSIIDSSDAVFEISNKVVEPIVVLSPNGGEQWHVGGTELIKWTAPSSVSAVDIEYSTDGGGSGGWKPVQMNVTSSGATPQYAWTIPQEAKSTNALVRVTDHSNPGLWDISNQSFTILDPIAGVEAPVAGMARLSVLGNFPNPFAGVTELRWRQAVASDVEIRVYAESGTMVARYMAGHREGGEQHFMISGAELSAGAYMYEIRSGGDVARGVMVLVR
jgi:hypothetical protein